MPLQATSGAGSYDAFGGGVPVVPNYIEEVFSTYLYTGNDPSTQNIINGIDLSTKGGMIWQKGRSYVGNHVISDTVRGLSGGRSREIYPNLTNAEDVDSSVTAFYNNGFRAGANGATNSNGGLVASWTFRKQPKFFDVVTYTGNGTAGRTVAHNLGSVPGCIIVKAVTSTEDWRVYHRSIGNTGGLLLQSTNAAFTGTTWNNTTPTATEFTLGGVTNGNRVGVTYVAYLFAHDAGGFGLTGTDNVISCGSYTGNGGTQTVTLGYEPQWVLIKNSDGGASGTLNWNIIDNMRGMPVGSNDNVLFPNTSDAEVSSQRVAPTATGFTISSASGNLNDNGAVYIYIAIRRGPMKVPTSGTSVFSPQTSYSVQTIGGTSYAVVTPSFPVDTYFWTKQSIAENKFLTARLLGASDGFTNTTDSFSNNLAPYWTSNTQVAQSASTTGNQIYECFRRAPSFHDVVCYTGTGVARTINHNLAAVPELMIVKNRSIASDWRAYSANLGATQNLKPNTTEAATSSTLIWNDTTPTSSVFSVGTSAGVNGSGNNHVAYLFATCAGVSKVGSYTGNGTSQTINCGFTGGARFVLIKRTSGVAAWVVFDSARGITSGTDPALNLNDTSAEYSPSTFNVNSSASGFEVEGNNNAANGNAETYIFLAIA